MLDAGMDDGEEETMGSFAKLAAVGAVAALSGLGIGLAVSAGPADATQPLGPSHAADMMSDDMTGMAGMSGMAAMSGRSDGDAASVPMTMSGGSMAEMHSAMPASMQQMHDAMPRSLREACDKTMAAFSSAVNPGSGPEGDVGPAGHEDHHP
jgi:hypothetical protein